MTFPPAGYFRLSDNVSANGWKLVLMAVVVLVGMAAITCALVYLGPLVGTLISN
jgi:hypothetical protein